MADTDLVPDGSATVQEGPPIAPTEVDQQQQAREAREAASRARRQAKPATPSVQTKPVPPGGNPFDAFDGEPKDDGIALAERNRLNRQDAFYRGSLPGSLRLSMLADVYRSTDGPDVTPERKAINKAMREEYDAIRADLAAYDEMQSFGTTMEALVSLQGQLEGTLIDPTNWIGWAAKGVTWLGRTARAGAQQAGITAAVDPAIQALNIGAGVREGYDPVQTGLSALAGFGIGAAGHAAGEGLERVVGQRTLRRQMADLAAEDASFANSIIEADMLAMERSAAPAPIVSREALAGPEHSFEDAVARIKKEAQEADKAANAEARERGESVPNKQPGERDFDARQKAIEEEIGPQIKALRDEGVDENRINDISKLYNRRPGEHPDEAFLRALDENTAVLEAEGIRVFDGVDSELTRELAEFNRAYQADLERSIPAGEAQADFRKGNTVMLPERAGLPGERIEQEIPFGPQGEARPAGGRADEPGRGEVPRGKGAAAEGGARAAGGGERAGQGDATEVGAGERGAGERESLKQQIARLKEERAPAEKLVRDALALENPKLVLEGPDGRSIVLTKGTDEAPYRITSFDKDGPVGHRDYSTKDDGGIFGVGGMVQEVQSALRNGYKVKDAPLATERTVQGEQTLIPGVQPVTDRQRLEAEMGRPLTGGDKPPPAGGLFDADARAQGDLLGLQATGDRPDLEALAQRKGGGGLYNEQDRPDLGVPGGPSPAKELTIRSLQQMSMDLAKALDVPVRQGRVQMRGALGTFSRRSGVVRVKEVPDFEVVVHEAGHAIEAKVGQELTDLTESFPMELRRLDYDQGPTGQRVNEGFAEYIRLRVGNPAAAANLAPTFTPEFEDLMRLRAPEMLKALDDAAVAYRSYLEAPSTDAIGSVVRSVDEEPTKFQKTINALRFSELPNTIKSVIQTSYTALFDDKAPVARVLRELGREIAKSTGSAVDLNAADNPAVLIRMLARARQAAVRDMMDGVRPYQGIAPEGPSLAGAISEAIGTPSVWGKWDMERVDTFAAYLVARRAEYLWRKFDAGDLRNPPAAFSAADARMAIAEFEGENPNFKNAGDMVHGYSRELLRKQFEGGLITQDLYAKLLKEEFYVPFMRDMSDKPMAGAGGGSPSDPGLMETVRRMQGSSRDIKNPIESLMMQTFLVNRTLRHNDIFKALVSFSDRAGIAGGKYVEPVSASQARKYTFNLEDAIEAKAKEIGMDPDEAKAFTAAMGELSQEDPVLGSFWKMERASPNGEPIVFYKDGGVTKAVRLMSKTEGHALYETLTAAPEAITGIFEQLIGTAASIKRGAITTNPTFIISNYIRDQFAAAILRPDYIPIISGMKGIAAEVSQGQSAILYGYAGGVAGGAAVGPVEHAAEANIQALAKKGYVVQRFTSLKGLLEAASITEAGTRNSIFATVFDQKKRMGLSDYDAMVEAAFQAQDILDFSRHGSLTLHVRNMVPFFNAVMQGMDKAYRTMIDPVIERVRHGDTFTSDSADFKNALLAWTKAGALGGSLGAVYAAMMWDKESYRDATPYFKGTHLIVPIGNRILVVPKPFELSLGFTAGEYAFQRLMQDDPRAGRQFLEAAMHSLAPPNPITDLPVISTTYELSLGKSMFTGRDIVPDQYKALPAGMQFNDRTSEIAKWLGKEIGVSPMKVDYAIGSQFGNWGRDVMALSQGLNEDAPAAAFDDMIFMRRFVKDPTRSSDVATRFWEFMGRSTGKYNQDVAAYDSLVRGFDDTRAKEFLSKLPENERAFVIMKSAGTENGKPVFKADEKRLHPLQRAYDAVTVLNGLRKELSSNDFAPYQTGEQRKLSPEMRRDLLEAMRELGQMEMRNAMVITKEPGYGARPMLDPNTVMDRIRNISPEVAEEIATRYATSKIYKTSAVEKAWPQVRKEVLRGGSDASIADYAADAKGVGYEFEGDRARKPLKRRVLIGPSPAPTP